MSKPRDYTKEYKRDHSSPAKIKQRAARNKARKEAGLKKGDPREVDHIVPLSKGGTNTKKNVRVVTRKVNRKKAARKG